MNIVKVKSVVIYYLVSLHGYMVVDLCAFSMHKNYGLSFIWLLVIDHNLVISQHLAWIWICFTLILLWELHQHYPIQYPYGMLQTKTQGYSTPIHQTMAFGIKTICTWWFSLTHPSTQTLCCPGDGKPWDASHSQHYDDTMLHNQVVMKTFIIVIIIIIVANLSSNV